MAHNKTANFLLQLSNFIRTSGEQGVIEALQEKILSGDNIAIIHQKLTEYTKTNVVCPSDVDWKVYKGDHESLVVYVMHCHYGLSHDVICNYFKDGTGMPISIPAISQKYSKIANMKKDSEKNIWMIAELKKMTDNISKIVGEKVGAGKKRGRSYELQTGKQLKVRNPKRIK